MKDKMKILYVVHGYKPAYKVGGPILSVSAAAEKLVELGHQVTVFTTNANLDEEMDVPLNRPVIVLGVEVWYFKRYEPFKKYLPFINYFSKSLGFLYTPDLKTKLLEKIKEFDVVHTQIPFVYPTYIAGKIAIKARKPLFYHQRGVFDPERLKFRGFKKRLYITVIEKPIMRRANALIALTDAEARNYRALGIKTLCHVIPNGINPQEYLQCPTPEFLKFFPIKNNQIMILFLGRLHPIKGVDLLLNAFIKIAAQFPDSVLVLAGPDEYGIEKEFKSKAVAFGLIDRVLFPGMVTGDIKRNLLARADLFCLPSVAEGFSMAILEALVSATPVMISPGCHFDEVKHMDVGWVIDRTVDAWAGKLSHVLGFPDQLIERRQAAHDFVANHYSWEVIVSQLEKVYCDGLKSHICSNK